MNKTQPNTVREEFSCEEWKSSSHCRSAYYLVSEQQTNKPNPWVTNANLFLWGKRHLQFSDSAVWYFQWFWLKFDFRIKRNLRRKQLKMQFMIGDKHHLIMTHDWRQCCCCRNRQVEDSLILLLFCFLFIWVFCWGFFWKKQTFSVQKNATLPWLKEGRHYWIFHCSFQKWKVFFFFFFFLCTSRFDVNLPFQAAVACLTGSSHTDAKTAQSWVKCAASFLPSLPL